MQVDDALIEKLAALSMLEFEAEEKEMIRKDLQQLIGFIDRLNAIDTSGVEPLLHMSKSMNMLRSDEPEKMISREQALMNSKQNILVCIMTYVSRFKHLHKLNAQASGKFHIRKNMIAFKKRFGSTYA